MTVQEYGKQMEKIRGIANQDISIFEYTPVRDVFRIRKQVAAQMENTFQMQDREDLFQIIEQCEQTIKDYLLL